MTNTLFTLLLLGGGACRLFAADAAPFEFKPNDRVVFIGDALVERDIGYNYLEAMLTVRLHGKGVTFRNAGWAGDTVWGESRAVFGSQKDGYNALLRIIKETKPTVAFLNYGMNESFAGAAGLANFEAGYTALLDDLAKQAPTARAVLISPIAFQTTEAPAAARTGKQNDNLKLYVEAIRKIAEKRSIPFVDLFSHFNKNPKAIHEDRPLPPTYVFTTDGLHLTATGYFYCALGIQKGLGLRGKEWDLLPQPGDYDSIKSADAGKPAPFEKLRALIAAKNLQFFNKWRPQNETYLFLFRKAEQGRNAKEIPEFDPFIEAKEKEIGTLADETAKGLGF